MRSVHEAKLVILNYDLRLASGRLLPGHLFFSPLLLLVRIPSKRAHLSIRNSIKRSGNTRQITHSNGQFDVFRRCLKFDLNLKLEGGLGRV